MTSLLTYRQDGEKGTTMESKLYLAYGSNLNLRQMAHPHLQRGKLIEKEGRFCLTEEGIFTSDDIISDLMYV